MTGAPPPLFDRPLQRRNLARAVTTRPAFLAADLATEISARLDLILRDFDTILVHGFAAPAIAETLRKRGGTVLAASPVPEPGVDLVHDADALPLASESVGLIVSVLTLQSAGDLPGALIQMRRALKPDGLLLACLFAGSTLAELRQAWLSAESERTGGASPRVTPFADLSDLAGLLQRAGLALPVADSDRTILRYSDALALMREIKALGFGHALSARSRRPVTRALLAEAAARYDRDNAGPDGKVSATVDIAWLAAWAPHPSQQQPLRPGSAKSRLADALNTQEMPVKRD